MNYAENMVMHGFRIERIRKVPGMNAALVEMRHEQSQAKLCWLDNKEENRFFSVGFQTLPEDDTGVFHILEHSVLCGSARYPLKEPFVELLKSSMNTFLNAMTYPDKTVYPVASRNAQDFLNLVSVYLDAVFAPLLRENPYIFYQEGWHLETEGDAPFYRGVVYNEMKGASSDPQRRMEEKLMALLFPDNAYRYDSGGDPAVIPTLTLEAFRAQYERWYHPSRALFYLQGDVPMDDTLRMIDAYLAVRKPCASVPALTLQKPCHQEETVYYARSTKAAKADMCGYGKLLGTWEDVAVQAAAGILCDLLVGSNAAPLKKAVVDSGLAQDIEMTVVDELAQPYLMIIARGMDASDSDKLHALILDTMKGIIAEGIDAQELHACISRFLFKLRTQRDPIGLCNMSDVWKSWMYGGDPLLYLDHETLAAQVRAMEENGAFAQVLAQMLPQGDHACVRMAASDTLAQEEARQEQEAASARWANMNEHERETWRQTLRDLAGWQAQSDAPEVSALVPKLKLTDVDASFDWCETQARQEGKVTLLHHPLHTEGIVYLNMYFPLSGYSLDQLSALGCIGELLAELPAAHDASTLQRLIKTYIGMLDLRIEALGPNDDPHAGKPYLGVHAAFLKENARPAQRLIAELLTESDFSDVKRLAGLLKQADERARQDAISKGHALAMHMVLSRYTAKHAITEAVQGYTYLKRLHALASDETQLEALIALLRQLQRDLTQEGLVISTAADEEIDVRELYEAFGETSEPRPEAEYRMELPQKTAIILPSSVGYAAKGIHLSLMNARPDGALMVIANQLSLDYLWNVIRVRQGAYGCGALAGENGSVLCYSYRDPSPQASLKHFDACQAYLAQFIESEAPLDTYIISALAQDDPLRSLGQKAYGADRSWFSGVTKAQRAQWREQMLHCERAQLQRWISAFVLLAQQGEDCIVGSEEACAEEGRTCYRLD